MELFKAHNQWKTRPSDERFGSVQALHSACNGYRLTAAEAEVPFSSLRVEAIDGDLKLVGKTGVPATLTHWSMGQLSMQASAPAGYLRQLPATLAAQNINHGLKARPDQDKKSALLFHQNGSLVLRAAVSESYTRIWNADISERLLQLQQDNPNWVNPMAYQVIEPGKNGGWPTMSNEMVPSGLYASDHDMFAFLIDQSKTFEGSPEGLKRGFFVWNSEVGASSFGIQTFLYDRVCGNNIVWGASNVMEFKIRHIGNADERAFQNLRFELKKYSESASGEIETMVRKAKLIELGATKEDVLNSVFALAQKVKAPELTRSRIDEALTVADKRQDRYGNPNTLWAVVSGLTEASQFSAYADERTKVDRAAGKLLKTIEF